MGSDAPPDHYQIPKGFSVSIQIKYPAESGTYISRNTSLITYKEKWMFMIIGIAIVVLLSALLAYAATKPGIFRVQRATSIKAPPERIFALINDFHRWGSWSPWEKLDPAMKRTHSGAASGKGAVYEW